jgi:hypothetical protein
MGIFESSSELGLRMACRIGRLFEAVLTYTLQSFNEILCAAVWAVAGWCAKFKVLVDHGFNDLGYLGSRKRWTDHFAWACRARKV